MPSLIQFKQFPLSTDGWTPIIVKSSSQVQKLWFEFTDSVKLCSNPEDPTTEYTADIAKGNQFIVPAGLLASPSARSFITSTIFYAKAINGPLTTVLCWIEQ